VDSKRYAPRLLPALGKKKSWKVSKTEHMREREHINSQADWRVQSHPPQKKPIFIKQGHEGEGGGHQKKRDREGGKSLDPCILNVPARIDSSTTESRPGL